MKMERAKRFPSFSLLFTKYSVFQAFWHPLVDKIVVGHYPGDWSLPEYGTERTIDIFDAVTGKLQYELKDPGFNGLVSVS